MSIIVNIRSTNGGGKSTTVKNILSSFLPNPLYNEKGKIRGYVCRATPMNGLYRDLYVVGPYETPTGGCDTIHTQDEICDRVREFSAQGDVLFEGLLVSGLFSRYNSLADELGQHQFIFAFLDTPLEKCISQTLGRRAAKGNTKPFDPAKTLTPKFEAILASRRKFEAAGGPNCECCKVKPCVSRKKDVRTLDHTQAAEDILDWLRE